MNAAGHRAIAGCFLGYVAIVALRKCFVTVMNPVAEDLHVGPAVLGAVNSAFNAAYGVSKFVGGIASDVLPYRLLIILGVTLSGVCCTLFPYFKSTSWFLALWSVHGLAQGFVWPSVTHMVVEFVPDHLRGRYWGILSTPGNVGQTLSPLLVTWCTLQFGWAAAFYLCGGVCVAVGIALSVLLPPSHGPRPPALLPSVADAAGNDTPTVTSMQLIRQHVLLNPWFWLLSLDNCLVYFVYKALAEWGAMAISHTWDMSITAGIAVLTWIEIGGFCGSLVAGTVSDWLGGRRILTSVIAACVLLPALLVVLWLPHQPWMLGCVMAVIGINIHALRSLTDLAALEVVHPTIVGAAGGFFEIIGQTGAVAAGYPLGHMAEVRGWDTIWPSMIVGTLCMIIALLASFPADNSKYKKNRD